MPSAAPLLSVIVPTRNRQAELEKCLASIAAARIEEMELLVVDDASTIPATLPVNDRTTNLIRLSVNSGSAFARNVAAAKARGEILLFVDDDVCVAPEALAATVHAFQQDSGLGAVIGRYDDAPACPHFYSRFRNLLHAYTHRVSPGPAETFWTGFGAVRTSVFREHGGFSATRRVIEDIEFGARLRASGVRIELHPALQVKHLKRWKLGNTLHTDLLLRGMPWTDLIWRRRSLPNTLNLRSSSRWSVGLACLLPILVVAAVTSPIGWTPVVACALTVLALNLPFYRFLQRRGGIRFAVACIGAHWLYFWVAGLSFVLGSALFGVRLMKPEAPASVTPSDRLAS